jgi:peptidoglycan/LPS O-acetylase OafA/YrhL
LNSDSPSRFPGLDSLRAYAALFVVIGHLPMTLESRGLPHPTLGAASFRGAYAVSFFFTLSGFLITYLLLAEQARRGTIDVKAFYLRRVLRIWPLYFAVITFGLVFYNLLLPAVGVDYPVHYSLPLATLLYTFFLPNLMNSLYTVGGILNPTWSIGIEEQFYLTWAPAVKRWHRHLPRLAGGVLVASITFFALSPLFTQGIGWQAKFLDQLKFHFMAVGALAAWGLHQHRELVLSWPMFRLAPWQWLLGLALGLFYFTSLLPLGRLSAELLQLVLYPWLVVEVGANPRRRLPLQNRFADWLGEISYGLYMLHMPVVYGTVGLLERLGPWEARPWLVGPLAYGFALGGTVFVAWLSFRCLERPILSLKGRFVR